MSKKAYKGGVVFLSFVLFLRKEPFSGVPGCLGVCLVYVKISTSVELIFTWKILDLDLLTIVIISVYYSCSLYDDLLTDYNKKFVHYEIATFAIDNKLLVLFSKYNLCRQLNFWKFLIWRTVHTSQLSIFAYNYSVVEMLVKNHERTGRQRKLVGARGKDER